MLSPSSKQLHVLELITTPMAFNGQTLFPLRAAAKMPGVRADFLTFAVDDERIREQVAELGGELFEAPHRLKHPVRYIRFVSRLVRREKYDAVHCHGNSCTLAIDLLAAMLGGAKVRIAHSHNTQCKYAALHRLLKLPFNLLYTHAMACGEEAGKWLFGRRSFTVVRNAIDTRRFAFDDAVRTQVRAEFGFENETVIGCVANYNPAKNHIFLLNVFAQLLKRNADYRLVLVGDGELRAEAEAEARRLNISDRVCFAGTRTDIPRLLQMMDLMVLPSLFEGFPTVALEWQAAGLPTLLADTITPQCAFVPGVRFVPLNADAWVDAILDTPVADRGRASRAGMQALAQAGYDLTNVAGDLQASYHHFSRSKSME